MELQRSVGAAQEQREALVASALHALQQVRGHLGAVHALRAEAVKPLDEALHVKTAVVSSPSLPALNHGGRGLPPRTALSKSADMMEHFFVKITQESAGLVKGASADWMQAASRPKPFRDRSDIGLGGRSETAPASPAVNFGTPSGRFHSPIYGHGDRPITPLAATVERARPQNLLRVPQPGRRSPARPLTGDNLLGSYETMRSHLSAARSLASL